MHFRLAATNSYGTTYSQEEIFETKSPPTISSVSASAVTATEATLEAKINSHEANTTYYFEYGTSVAYGSKAPAPAGEIDTGNAEQTVSVHLTGLAGTPYHFRLIATSEWGTTTSTDRSFTFYPPSCPNAHVRQQTETNFLPDRRAYELVSPANAGGTSLFPGGPNSGLATNPSRMAYVGQFGTIPGTGQPINGIGDLYVATRTDNGWVSRYVGPPGDEVGCAGGPPQQALDNGPATAQNKVLTNPDMSRFLDWNDGNTLACGGTGIIDRNTVAQGSDAPISGRPPAICSNAGPPTSQIQACQARPPRSNATGCVKLYTTPRSATAPSAHRAISLISSFRRTTSPSFREG